LTFVAFIFAFVRKFTHTHTHTHTHKTEEIINFMFCRPCILA